jgi:plastocyanin
MARLRTAVTTVVIAAAAIGSTAAPASAAKQPPVKISGTVNNKGTAKVAGSAVSIEAGSFYFEKTFLKTKPGAVTVKVENESGITHTFTVDGQDVDVELPSGRTKTVTVEVGTGDPVVFYCRFHRGSGMQGAFFTAAGRSTPSGRAPSGVGSGASSSGY